MIKYTTLTEFVEEQLTKFEIPDTEKIVISYASNSQEHSKKLEFGMKQKQS